MNICYSQWENKINQSTAETYKYFSIKYAATQFKRIKTRNQSALIVDSCLFSALYLVGSAGFEPVPFSTIIQ